MNRNIWIGIIVIVVIVAGGWWYLNQSSVPAVSETTQLPSQNNQTGAQPPVSTRSSDPSATIDQNSLATTSSFPTITGTATNASTLSIDIDGYFPAKGNTVALYNGTVSVVNGHWSFTPSKSNAAFGGPQGLGAGTYSVVVGQTEASSLTTGVLVVN